MRQSLYGTPLPASRSRTTVLIVEPTLGFNATQPETDLPLGQTPESVNWIMRDGALEPRSRLSTVGANENPVKVVTGGYEVVNSVGSVFPIVSGTTQIAYYSNGSWSKLSYVSANGVNAPPSATSNDFYDIVQTYYPDIDEMVWMAGCESYQTLYTGSAGSATFSTVSSAPMAKYLTTLNDYVLAFNIKSGSSRFVQRVQWSDRGGPFTWTPSTSNNAGLEDLLSAKGQGTAIKELDTRVILFFEHEIWQGIPGQGARIFDFAPLDRTIGTTFTWTIQKTPLGLIFLGPDFMLYLIPKDGSQAVPVGKPVQRRLRDTIDLPSKAHAVYDEQLNAYRLFYAVRGGPGYPTEEFVFNLLEHNFAPQTYALATGTRAITRAFPAYSQSATAGLTWSDISTAGYTWDTIPFKWNQMLSTSTNVNRTIFAGSSDGTVYQLSSLYTTDDGTPVEARWRTSALGGDFPEGIKQVNAVLVDCATQVMSHLTVRVSRDGGASFDVGQQVTFGASSIETQAAAWVATPALFPMVELTTEDIGVKVYRLWLQMRAGGSYR